MGGIEVELVLIGPHGPLQFHDCLVEDECTLITGTRDLDSVVSFCKAHPLASIIDCSSTAGKWKERQSGLKLSLERVDVSELELQLAGLRASEETLQQGIVALKQCR